MSSKYYKIVLDDLSNIEYYGTKANVNAAAHPQNFQSLEILYNIRYPMIMAKLKDLIYLNYIAQENNAISQEERNAYNVPSYLLVADAWSGGYFQYQELSTGITILIPSEIYAKSYRMPLNLRKEITPEELIELYNDDYIDRVCNLFGIIMDKKEKEQKLQLIKHTQSK